MAIVGGGIGGLATALAFQRLTNLTYRVYERSPTLRGGEGTALTMWPNGLSALGAIDPALLTRVGGWVGGLDGGEEGGSNALLYVC